MRGGWVALLDKGFQVRFNPNSFSFGITQRTGANAPFYKDNPPAYIGAHYSLASKCLMDDGNPLIAEASNMYIAAPGWNQNKETNHCPIYDYGTGLDNRSNFNSDSYRHRGTDEDGDYYEIDLFPITLKLKRIESVYVRGIDDAGTFVTDSPTDLYATSGTTELNLINLTTDATLYWPGAPKQDGEEHPESADWTLAPKDYYGGVIPGGIFIEQVPELTQFEPSFDGATVPGHATNTAFCPGEDVKLTATVKFPGGSQRNQYHVALWTPANHDGFTAGASALKPLVELDGNSNTNTSNPAGYTIETTAAATAGTATYTITMTQEAFKKIANSEATGNTDYKKIFRFVVTEGAGAPSPSTKTVTKETAAEIANLPKVYLNAITVELNPPTNIGPLLNSPGYNRTADKPVGKLTDAYAGAKVYLRNDCQLNTTASGLNTSCYYLAGETPFKTLLYASADGTAYSQITDENTIAIANQFATLTTLGTDPKFYFNQLEWQTGCITQTDTIQIEPRKELPAPSLSIFSDCTHLFDEENPFSMQASTSGDIEVQQWQWVIRAEDGTSYTDETIATKLYQHAPQGVPCNAVDPNVDPLTARPSGFGGGWIFNVDKTGYTESVNNSYDESDPDGLIKFDIAFTHGGSSSNFSVTRVAGGAYSWPTIMGQWLPIDRDIASNGANSDYETYAIYTYGESKFVYVRYQSSNGDWSPWQVAATGMKSQCENMPLQYFGITVENAAHCPGTQMSKEKDILSCKSCSTDMTAVSNTKLQFYLTAFGFYESESNHCSFSISEEEKIEWIATDDAGNQTVFASIAGPKEFAAKDYKNDAYACDPGIGTVLLIPAPQLYTVTKNVKVRAAIVNIFSNVRSFSGWFPGDNGVLTVDECISDVTFDVSGGVDVLNDEYVKVELESVVKLGKLEAKRDGTVIPTDDAMCVGSELELALTGEVDFDAMWEWQKFDGTAYVPIAGVTGRTYKYVPDKTVFTSLSNPDDYWDSGVEQKFRLVVTSPSSGDSKNHDFTVKVFWAEKIVIGKNGVDPDVAITTGVCEGMDVKLIGRPADNMGWYKTVSFEFQDGTWQNDAALKPSQNVDLSYELTLADIQQQYWDNIPVRFKGIFPTSNSAVTCVAYSDTVTLKVNKLAAGTISTTQADGKLCIGQVNTLIYSGAGDSIAWYQDAPDPIGTGNSIQVTPTGAAGDEWTIEAWAFQGKGVGACEVGTTKKFTLKACNITLTPDPAAFCFGDATVAKDGVKLRLGTPYAVTKLEISTNGTDFTVVDVASYDASTAATNGEILLKAAYVTTLTAANYTFKATVTVSGNAVETDPGVLTINPLPTISDLGNTSDGPVCEGATLTFTAKATAKLSTAVLTPTYKWYYAATQTDANNHNGTAVPSGDGIHNGANRTALSLTTTAANRGTLDGRWYYAEVTAVSQAGCTTVAYTPAVEAEINALPDVTNVITGTSVGGVAGTSLSVCAGTGLAMEVTTDDALGYTYKYTWKKGSANLPSGATSSNSGNKGSTLTFSDEAAVTANSGDYVLTIEASNADGCKKTTTQTLSIMFANCGRDKLKDATAEHDKTKPYVVCANDSDWPIVDVEPATLPASGGGNATVTAVTLYHRFGTSGEFAQAATQAAGTVPFDVKGNTNTAYKTEGSHYYFAKVERTGYAPTYTDTAEYVIGALPVSQLASAKVMATAKVPGFGTVAAGPTDDLTVCAGLNLELSLTGMPADGTDAFAAAGVPKANSYQWRKGTSSTVPDGPTGTAVPGQGDIVSLGAATAGAAGQSGWYYAYRTYERQTKINSTQAAKTCSSTFKIPAAAEITVNPKPALPTAMAGDTKNLCDGDAFDLTTTTTPAAPAAGTTWTYRWHKKRGTGSTVIAYPADGTSKLPNLNAISVTADADGATAKVTDVYTLKVYGQTAEGCVDSTAALTGITVNITPLPSLTAPTVTVNPASGAICAGATATLSVPAVSVSGSTVAYQWYKCKNGTTQDPAVDDKVGTGTSYTTPATAAAAGSYYVHITATPTGNAACLAAVNTAVVAVTVNPLPELGGAFTATTGGVAGYQTSVCKDETPILTVVQNDALGYTYTYTWPTAGGTSSPVTGGSGWKLNASETANAPATKTYTLKVRATTAAGCTKDTTLTFTVEVSACDKDAVQNGRDGTARDEHTPFTVCAGEAAAAWPTVKIVAQNMAGRTIEKIELFHSYNSKADADFRSIKSTVPNALTGDLTFDPSTETVSGHDFKQPGSHYYYAVVTRTGNNNNLRTSVVEYVVGAMPEPTVVNGASIMVSLEATQAAAVTAGDDNSLTMCAGPHAYLHLKDMPALPAGTTHTKYEWFKGTGATVPADPKAAAAAGATSVGTTGTVDLGATAGITAKQTDYYYSYHTFARTTPINSTSANQTCDTIYKIGTAGVRIVNPMPVMPTQMDAQTLPVCDGATVSLTPKNIDAKPAAPTGTTWTYRWYKNGTAVSPVAGDAPATSDGYSFTAVHGGTPGAGNNQLVSDAYTLKVYAATADGCADSVLLNNTVTVQITPEPYADKPVVEATGGGTGTDGKPYVCEGATVTLRLKNDPLPNNGKAVTYKWYKKDGTNRTALQNGDVYQGVELKSLTVTGKETDQFGMTLAGEYLLVATVKMNNANCTAEVVSDAFELAFSERPEVRVTNESATDFSLCPGEETELSVKLDAATESEVAAGTATVTYQWYKGGKTAAVSGATAATLNVQSTDVGTPTTSDLSAQYFVKVTKLTVGYNCPTEVWSDAASATAGNGGIGKAFTVKVLANCDPEAIVDKDAPTVVLTPATATAICSAEADPGKTFMLKASGGRPAVTKATWYYAPVTEDAGGKLVMGAIQKGKECSNIASGATACPFSTKTDGGMTAPGEWRLWVDVERDGANTATTDTIHFVIRPNPTLTNESSLKAVMQKKGETTEVPDHLVCEGTEIQLQLNTAPALNTLIDSKDKTETRTETITNKWICTNCSSSTGLSTDAVYSFKAPGSGRNSVTATDAPDAATFQGDYELTQTYTRAYQRTGAPTYNITCPVVNGTTPLEKQFPVSVFTSVAPKGTLADAAGKTAMSYCTTDLDGASLKLVFTPQTSGTQPTPAAEVTEWEYSADNGANWTSWQAADGTTPNELTIGLTDSKLTLPAAGAVKTYQFRAQVANGPCDKEIGTYTLSLYGALAAGTLTAPQAVCTGASNTNISVTASGFAPANATIHFVLYETDPSAGGATETVPKDVTGAAGSAKADLALPSTPTEPTKYYVRYEVKNPETASPCAKVYSDVKEVMVYPSGEIRYTGANGREVCFQSGETVTFDIVQNNTTGFDLYAFDRPVTAADLKAQIIAGSVSPIATENDKATSVTATYDNKMYENQTYYYFVAKTGLYAIDKSAACAMSIAETTIKTIKPLTQAVIAWENTIADPLVIDEGLSHKITLTGGEHQRVDRAEIAATLHYAPDNGSGQPDKVQEQTRPNFMTGYEFQFTQTGLWHFWVVVDGTPCDDEESNVIKAQVNASTKLLLEGENEICSDGDIELAIKVSGNNADNVDASTIQWQYSKDDGANWTDLNAGSPAEGGTVTVSATSPFTMTWSGRPAPGLSAGPAAYKFKLKYSTTGGTSDETPAYAVTVYPKPYLSSMDALNLPHAICDQTPFDIKLKDGVTATQANVTGIVWTLQFTQKDPATAQESDWTTKSKDASGDVLHRASNLTDSGYYRLRITGNKVCASVTSNAALLTVNAKPKAGKLSMTPAIRARSRVTNTIRCATGRTKSMSVIPSGVPSWIPARLSRCRWTACPTPCPRTVIRLPGLGSMPRTVIRSARWCRTVSAIPLSRA